MITDAHIIYYLFWRRIRSSNQIEWWIYIKTINDQCLNIFIEFGRHNIWILKLETAATEAYVRESGSFAFSEDIAGS